MTQLMNAVYLKGSPFNPKFSVGEFALPEPGDDDVLVRVHASSVNPKDWKLNYNLARASLASPLKPSSPLFGDDLAGEVVAVGQRVVGLNKGDLVYGMDMRLRTAAMAKFAVINQKRITKIPQGMTAIQAAGIPLAAQTALQGLRLCGTKPGTRILINGSSGGVGVFAVQMARELGAEVTAVSSQRNAELVQRLGAHHWIDYTKTPISEIDQQFDAVFEVTGYLTFNSCKHLVAPTGQFVSTMGSPKTLIANWLSLDKRDKKVVVESYTHDLDRINYWFTQGKLDIVIDSEFDHNQVGEAYARSQSGRASGKIVVRMDQI